MLELFTKMPKNCMIYNDDYFDDTRASIVFDNTVKGLITQIDGATYVNPFEVYSKYDMYKINSEYLSTGCKTAINIYSNPDICFYGGECGENALQKICEFQHGKVYIAEFFIPLPFSNAIKVITHKGNIKVHNHSELERVLGEIF